MGGRSKLSHKPVTIVEAIETLSSIAEMNFEKGIGVAELHDLTIDHETVTYRTVHWLNENEGEDTIKVIKETFRVVLGYLKNFYEQKYIKENNTPALEGIKSIMILVGEAGKKLDKFTHLFKEAQGSVLQLKEYQDLQHFYKTRLAQRVDEKLLGKWIYGITKRIMKKNEEKAELKLKKSAESKYAFVDLENAKKDIDYELFYIRKEDGTRFFSPRLIRNMKLVSDFGETFWDNHGEDPLKKLRHWQDRMAASHARSILNFLGNKLDRFFKESLKCKTKPLTSHVNSAIMALMLAGKDRTLTKLNKSSLDYFIDFQTYLSQAISSRDFQKQILYPIDGCDERYTCEMVEGVIQAFFIENKIVSEFGALIQGLLHAAFLEMKTNKRGHKNELIHSDLKTHYDALKKMLIRHPGGPISNTLLIFEQGDLNVYEPLQQKNWPTMLYTLNGNNKTHINCLRLPSPISQEYIHKAQIADEFNIFIRSCSKDHYQRRHLYINLQDRTSWKEYARASILEMLQNDSEIEPILSVITLPNDTDFYHQSALYEDIRKSPLFIDHFLELLKDESGGFYFPNKVRKELSQQFLKNLFHTIHKVFFHDKNILSRDERIVFIDIAYLMMTLKILDHLQPDSFNISCKDALDGGLTATSLLFIFVKLLSKEEVSSQDLECFHFMLFGPQLLTRERVLMQERFSRFLSSLRWIEEIRNGLGFTPFKNLIKDSFASLFPNNILDTEAHPLS